MVNLAIFECDWLKKNIFRSLAKPFLTLGLSNCNKYAIIVHQFLSLRTFLFSWACSKFANDEWKQERKWLTGTFWWEYVTSRPFEITKQEMYWCSFFVNAANYRNFLKDNFKYCNKMEKINCFWIPGKRGHLTYNV